MAKNYYKILGINKDANNQEIKSAYRELAKRWHPDICKEPNAHEMFIEISEAYEILVDPSKRQQYDRYFNYEQQSKGQSYRDTQNERNRQYENTDANYDNYRRAQEEARRKAEEYASSDIEDLLYTLFGIVFKIGEQAAKTVIYGLEGEQKQDGSKVSLFENFIIGIKGVLLLVAIILILSLVGSPIGIPLGILVVRSLWHKGRFVGILPLIGNTIIVALILIVIVLVLGIYTINNF